MDKLIHEHRHGKSVYEIVEEVPVGYTIWHIGKNAPEGYLPLCRLSPYQPFPGGRSIDPYTLKAIKIDGAQDILAAVGYGVETLSEMEQYVKLYRNSKNKLVQHRVALYQKAIPFMRKIKGIEHLTM